MMVESSKTTFPIGQVTVQGRAVKLTSPNKAWFPWIFSLPNLKLFRKSTVSKLEFDESNNFTYGMGLVSSTAFSWSKQIRSNYIDMYII